MSKIKEKTLTDDPFSNSIGRSQKHAAENSQPKSNENNFDEDFQHFTKQYKEELNLYRRNIKRLSEKSQELEMSILEYKGALERSQEVIKVKGNEIEKHIADKNHIKDEKNKLLIQYHKLEKQFAENELNYAKHLEKMTKDNEIQINKERENHLSTVKELTGNLNDLMQKLQQSEETHEQKIKQLQATFAEQKLIHEAENQSHINELMIKLQEAQQEKELVEAAKLHTINQQAEEIANLKDELKKSQELISELEIEKKRLVAEQNYRLSTIERVFSNPVNGIIPKRSLADEITANVVKAHTNGNLTEEYTTTSSAKNTSNDGNAKLRGQRFRGQQRQTRQHQLEQEEPPTNQSETVKSNNTSSTLTKPRAVKRKTNYAVFDNFSTSEEDDVNATQRNMEQFKMPRLDASFSECTATSLMRFTSNNKSKKDHVVIETSESDAFDRVKAL